MQPQSVKVNTEVGDGFAGRGDLGNERGTGSEIVVFVVLIDVRVFDEIHIIRKVVDVYGNRSSTIAVCRNIVGWQEE